MENLCNFSCCFDVKKDISGFINTLRSPEAAANNSSDGNAKRKKDKSELDVRIIGQERFNEVLYVWDDVSSFSNKAVTHVGLYDPAKQKNSVLFVHEKKLNIISCTMNQERSMIAYVTLEGPSKSDSYKDSTKQKTKTKISPFVVYRAFLAEIFPQHRIFDLNVERRNLLRVQFLWNRQPKDRDSANRESKLLFLLHKESIGLYSLPLARMGNKGVMMSGPPDTLQVLKQFIWAQWDVVNQRLFVVLMKSWPGNEKLVPIMRCLEFNSKTSPVTKILELVLPFPIKFSAGKEQYSDVTPSRTMSESSFNMEVIVQAGGSFCVCYQHPTKPKVKTPPTHKSYPKISTVHTSERLSTDSDTDSLADSVEQSSSLPSQMDLRDPPQPDTRRRAISDISSFSPSAPYIKEETLHNAENLELSSDLSSITSSTEVVHHPLHLDIHRATQHTQSPRESPRTPSSAFSSPMMWGERELPSPLPNAEKQDLVDLNYSVLILHHMTVLHCSVPQIPRALAESTKLYFTCLGSYILVYSPGHMLHLLNVSPEIVPCLHIAFHGPSVPVNPVIENNGEGSSAFWDSSKGCQILTHFNRERTGSMSGDCIFNAATGKVFRVSINKDVIPRLLIQANCHSVKLALIHLITVHIRDSVLIQKFMKELSMDVTNLDLSELMAEHLMGATFSAIRRQFDRDTLRLLQFTNTDTTRGQLVETTDGERLVSFRHAGYNTQPQVNVHKRDWMERRLTMEVSSSTLWETLEQRVRAHSLPSDPTIVSKPPQRFHPRSIEQEIRKQRTQSAIGVGLTRQGPSTQRSSFFKKMAASARRAMTPTKKSVITMQPERDSSLVLMDEDASRPDNSQDGILSMTSERLTSHLSLYSASSVSHEKILNMSQEYVMCQLQQVRQLVLLMLHSCGYPDPRTIPRSTIRLNTKPPPMGYQLFRLLERFYMAVQSLCFPVPPGFQTFFTIQGFRCLEPAMFLQYVDHGILRLTEEFMTRLMQEVPDDTEEQVNMKIQILTRLPKGSVQVLQRWNHPISMEYLAQQYVAETLKEEGVRTSDYRTRSSRSASQNSQSSGMSDGSLTGIASTFPPLSTLLRLLEAKDPKV
ncbi:gamma-secretase-activating protein-like isoform X2 [Patiria miniata]|nr:gamma-secretase-activating protein-like isoform X2 [Patiria miniata]